MRYDPFASASDQDRVPPDPSQSVGYFSKLDRWPGVLSTALTPLEWKGGNIGSDATDLKRDTKRPRASTHVSESTAVTAQSEAPPKVVEKVVEKVIRVPVAEPLTLLGLPPPVDDRVRNLVSFILQHVTQPGVEVEAKLGTLIVKSKNIRACDFVPTLCESPIRAEEAADIRFESAVHHSCFAYLNKELNRRVEATSSLPNASERVMYLRTRELDFFWPDRVRETRQMSGSDENGNETYETIRVQRKTRLGNLNFLCPSSIMDVRYSASLEMDASRPPRNVADPAKRRLKDRISYKFDFLSVDITAVETTDPAANLFNQPTHEIEIEIDSSANLFGEVEKYRNGDPTSQLFRIATALVSTVRIIMEEAGKAVVVMENLPAYDQQQAPVYSSQHGAMHQPPPLDMHPQSQYNYHPGGQLPPAQQLVAQADMQRRQTQRYSSM